VSDGTLYVVADRDSSLSIWRINARQGCPDEDGDGRVTICHYPPGNREKSQTITVSSDAVAALLDHGDSCGPCP
jgi:hypothetical protein